MKTWKLLSGIISIVLSAVVVYQSRAASFIDRIANNLLDVGSYSGTIGYIVALLMVAGGIVSIVTRKGSKPGDISIVVLFGIASLLGYTMGGIYVDLIVWSTWCIACATVAVISLVRGSNTKKLAEKEVDQIRQTINPQINTGHVYQSDVDATVTRSIDFSFGSFIVGLIVSIAGLVFLFFSWWGLAAVVAGLATLIFAYFQQ